jgi:hypothetical protein
MIALVRKAGKRELSDAVNIANTDSQLWRNITKQKNFGRGTNKQVMTTVTWVL